MAQYKLERLAGYKDFEGPVLLVIMDGVGIGKGDASDGVHMANTPHLDALMQEPLFTRLKAHGTAVGQPSDEDMGNSEVGHNALGAGRVFAQGARLVNEAIAEKRLYDGKAWKTIAEKAAQGGHAPLYRAALRWQRTQQHLATAVVTGPMCRGKLPTGTGACIDRWPGRGRT